MDVREILIRAAEREKKLKGASIDFPASELARYIDHTLLKPEAGPADVRKVAEEALKYGFASVCVNPAYVSLVSEVLRGSGIKTCSVVGFPLGANKKELKVLEARRAFEDGAQEIDMVMNIGMFRAGERAYVEDEIAEIAELPYKFTLKVIIEACLLTDEEKAEAALLVKKAGAHYVKTSTGFSKGGATLHDVAILREAVGPDFGVKAAGGIRTYEDAVLMIKAGANRIGASRSLQIIKAAG